MKTQRQVYATFKRHQREWLNKRYAAKDAGNTEELERCNKALRALTRKYSPATTA